jgi:hypothetical protein
MKALGLLSQFGHPKDGLLPTLLHLAANGLGEDNGRHGNDSMTSGGYHPSRR